ncbi:MAG: right-handed parallel beta-helix repeat-containing protein, partial [Armatimonadetes bacterium]|nr:right-handed parallel beta-helix repeat-containing protein [Armatimonadota bacterium]
ETVVNLVVNDGFLNSVADTVAITVNFSGETNNIYYVDPGGDDSNPGTVDQPWATVEYAYSTVTPGDTVYFREGTYVLNGILQNGPHGTSEAERTLFASYEGESVVWDENQLSNPLHLNCDYVTIEGVEIANGSSYGIEVVGAEIIIHSCEIHDHGDDIIKVLSSSPHCVVEDCELYGSAGGKSVIDAVGSQGLTIHHNYIHNTDSIQAIVIKGGATDAVVCNNLLVNATVADEYSAAISLGGATAPEYMQGPWECMDSIAYNNVIVGTPGQGIIFWDANNCAAYNNTLLGIGDRYGVRIFTDDLGEQTQNITFKNNIVHCVAGANHKAVLQVDGKSTTGLDINHNLWFCEGGTEYVVWAAGYEDYGQRIQFSEYQTMSGQDANSIVGDPLLTEDYHLTADSPATDAGTYEPGVPSHDFDGNPRPYGDAIDVGAYEYTAAGVSYSISGTILDTESNPVADVTVTAGSHSGITAADGSYTIESLSAGTYTVTPALAGYGFVPESAGISVGSGEGSSTGVDFVRGSIFTLTLPIGLSLVGVPCTPLGDDSPGSVFGGAQVVRWDPIALQYVAS